MVNENIGTERLEPTSKSEQSCTNANVQIVAADIIRTAEIRMQQKGMLPGGTNLVHNPFWFLVETEKNVFLWRSGSTLSEKENFDFWVDIQALFEKRLSQLERQNLSNPFNSVLEEFELSIDPVQAEKEYLIALRDAISPILLHLSALSEVQREIVEEHLLQKSTKVVLPQSSKGK